MGSEATHEECQGCKCTGVTAFKWREPMFGKELDRDAQVWEIYVDETERYDKEMMKEWTDSLDVLLVFAALFSAITISLVIESANQLQPDPIVQELQAISEILLKASNEGKPVDYVVNRLPFPKSPANRSIVLTNALWFVSLGLSVVVSLAAMLSKGWCNEFIANRIGEKYEQGRRRQIKWDGIESWGMRRMFVYLPTVMHLAILLFGVGLALYLWTINILVAIPIVALGGISVLLYIAATIIPHIYDNCPYSTPFSELFAPLRLREQLFALVKSSQRFGQLLADTFGRPAKLPKAIVQIWFKLSRVLLRSNPVYSIRYTGGTEMVQITNSSKSRYSPEPASNGSLALAYAGEVPMDEVSCHMLRWLIVHCEDERLVDTMLLSIAGGCRELPRAPLVAAHALELISDRLSSCFGEDPSLSDVRLNPHLLTKALLYTRAFLWLSASDWDYGLGFDRWSYRSNKKYRGYSAQMPNATLGEFFRRFRGYLYLLKSTELVMVDPHLAAIVASIVIPTAHYYDGSQRPMRVGSWAETPLGWYSPMEAQKLSTQLIQRHIDQTVTLHGGALLCILQATPHWMIEMLSTMDNNSRCYSIMLLVELLSTSACAAVEFQHAIGLSLTIAAMILHTSYPGWERYESNFEGVQARLIDVYGYHTAHRYEESQSLVAFGLLGLMRVLEGHTFDDDQIVTISKTLERVKYLTSASRSIHTLPEAFTLRHQCGQVALQHIRAAKESRSHYSESVVTKILDPLSSTITLSEGEAFAQVISLACDLHGRRHAALRSVCFQILDLGQLLQDSDPYLVNDLDVFAQPELLDKLLEISLKNGDPRIATSAMLYLWKVTECLIQEETRMNLRRSWTTRYTFSPDVPCDRTRTQLARVLCATAHAALRRTMPNLPPFPQHIYETGLAHKWYPLLTRLSVHESGAEAIITSGILQAMLMSLDGNQTRRVAPYSSELQDGELWHTKLNELNLQCLRSVRSIVD